MSIGNNILRIRTSNHLTQEQFAEMLSVSRQSVSKWELDQAVPETDKVLLISQLFSVSTDEVLSGEISNNSQIGDSLSPITSTDYSESTTLIFEKEYSETINGINIDTSLCNIYFYKTENTSTILRIHSDVEKYEIIFEEGILTVNESDKSSTQKRVSKIEIYLSCDTADEINIDNQFGNVIFESANKINIKVNQGTVKIIDKVNSANISCNLGNIEIGIVEREMQLSSSLGDILIGYISLENDSFAKTALGNISIGGNEDARIVASANMGDLMVNNKYPDSDIILSLNSNVGNITVN